MLHTFIKLYAAQSYHVFYIECMYVPAKGISGKGVEFIAYCTKTKGHDNTQTLFLEILI